MTLTQEQRPKMTVDVSLCGSIPRSEMAAYTSRHLRREHGTIAAEASADEGDSAMDTDQVGCGLSSGEFASSPFPSSETCPPTRVPEHDCTCPKLNAIHTSEETLSIAAQRLSALQDLSVDISSGASRCPVPPVPPPSSQAVEPPHWAVAARGDAHLEPICDSIGTQTRVDLTTRSFFRVGRSPTSDVQLMHATSSRRHAILFHHPNGSCYIVDCGSAHGTYVNGARVQTTVTQPSLGEASSGMVIPHRVRKGSLIRFGGIGAPTFILKSFSVGIDTLIRDLGTVSEVPSSIPDIDDPHELDLSPVLVSQTKETGAAVVLLNTRINAVGNASAVRYHSRQTCASVSFESLECLGNRSIRDSVSLKRSLDTVKQTDTETSGSKRIRLLESTSSEIRQAPKFVSPSVSPVREWTEGDILKTPLKLPPPPPLSLAGNGLKITLPPKNEFRRRRVRFCDDKPQYFFAPSVTPDEFSDEDVEVDGRVVGGIFCPPTTPRTMR